jgi:GAF domain-containing protein
MSNGTEPRRAPRSRTWDEADLVCLLAALTDTFVQSGSRDRFPQALVELTLDLVDVEGSAVTLRSAEGALEVLSATDPEVQHLERLQVTDRDGGPVTAVTTGSGPTLLDLTGGRLDRYPALARAASAAGIGYVFAVPIRRRVETFGSLTLYGAPSRYLGPHDRDLLRAVADIAAAGLAQRRAVDAADFQISQLEQALTSRVVIEQAKGVLLAEGHADLDSAFLALRQAARSGRRRLEEVAREIVDNAGSAATPLRPHPGTATAWPRPDVGPLTERR